MRENDASAADGMQADGGLLPSETRIGRTALTVADLDELTAFYRDVVGLSVLSRDDARAVLGVAETPLLVLEHDPEAPTRHRSGAGLFHNAFRVPSRAALGDALARIRQHWQLGGASDHGVSEALYATDPEGNGVEVYRDYPRSDWPRGDDGSLQIGTYHLDLAPLEAAAGGQSGLPPETDVGHVHLEVSSLDAFREFFVETVGFDVQTDTQGAQFVSAGGYHHHLAANTWSRRTGPVSGRGLAWFEVVVPDSEARGVLRERIEDGPYSVTTTETGFAVTGPDELQVRFRA